jgi:hypothetical protein
LKQVLAALVSAASLLGCATVPLGDAQQSAASRTFSVAPDRAAIYVFRNEDFGGLEKVYVHVDTAPVGQTVYRTYVVKHVMPGRHTITSSAENTDTLEIDAEAGSVSFIWQEVKWGWFTVRTKLHLVGEDVGRKGVVESRLVQSLPVTQTVELRVEADDTDWRDPLDCEASNSLGSWPFVAPGTVVVETSTTPLQVVCKAPAGTVARASNSAPNVDRAAATGAWIGGGTTAALALASAPLLGPALAVAFAVAYGYQSAVAGAAIGSAIAGDKIEYPSPITIQIKRAPMPP